MTTETQERYFTTRELAEHFGVSLRTVQYWKSAGCPHLKLGHNVRYKPRDVEVWLTLRSLGVS